MFQEQRPGCDDGHFVGFRAFVCESDADATIWAKQLVDGHDVELWSGERFVVKVEAKRESPQL